MKIVQAEILNEPIVFVELNHVNTGTKIEVFNQ